MTQKLTVIIPCKNEAANMRGCLHSARKVADELLIADSGSTDGTLEMVCAEPDTRVIEREYVNSGNFKNWAIPQATHSWVLILDADERIPDSLAREIRRVLESGSSADGYWIPRAGYFMGHRVRFSGWQNDRVLRLFRRDVGVYYGESDHAEVRIGTGRVGRLRNRLLHYTCWDYHDYFKGLQRYATYQAERWYAEGRSINRLKLFCNFPFRFLQLYLLRLGFLDGLVGLQVCALTALYSFSKQACLWQLCQGRARDVAGRDAKDVIVADESLSVEHVKVPFQAGTEKDSGIHVTATPGSGATAVKRQRITEIPGALRELLMRREGYLQREDKRDGRPKESMVVTPRAQAIDSSADHGVGDCECSRETGDYQDAPRAPYVPDEPVEAAPEQMRFVMDGPRSQRTSSRR